MTKQAEESRKHKKQKLTCSVIWESHKTHWTASHNKYVRGLRSTQAGTMSAAATAAALSSYECWECWFRGHWYFSALIHSGSFTLSSSSFTGFPEPPEEGFRGYISYRAECSKVSHSLHSVWLWVSAFVPNCCRRRLFWWWLGKVLIYVFSRMS